ncbi:MAG: NADP-dependent oxidoreductase [Porticoccaceae bacterium]
MSDPFVPDYSQPPRNRRVLLVDRPQGIPEARHFAVDDAELPSTGEGQLLVRNVYLSVDPAQRGWVADGANYAEPVAIGSVMRALAVGVVVESRHRDFVAGEFVYGWLGWQDYAVITPGQVMYHIREPSAPLSAYAGVLGMNGVTAYLGLRKLGRPEAGETVLVSTAAGAVGSVVGQIAHNLGCRTVGLTGSDDKVALCENHFGYDVALNYKAAPVAELLAGHIPDGADVFFDNVGGATLDAGLRAMRVGGRIVQCGTASIAAWNPPPQGLRNEREVLTRRLVWSGFVIFDHMADFAAAVGELAAMVRQGQLRYEEDIDHGIEHAPGAIQALYAGENRGKKLIYIG